MIAKKQPKSKPTVDIFLEVLAQNKGISAI
jgi:hypothetical protein